MVACCSAALAQTTYYVAATGNDANTGRSPATPFLSLAKVNSLALQAGDSVLFRRGDTFRGTLVIRRSGSAARPIVFSAYGSGAKPILAGSVPVTNWTNVGGNVWQASCASCGPTVTGVYRNDTALPLGRYPNYDAPNKGYLTILAHTERYQIFSVERLPAGIDWKGGEVVMRPTQWILDRAIIDHQYGDALNLINNSTYYPADGWGFFIQSHPAALDQNGEWYYNPTAKTIRLYASTTNPNSQTITATTSRGVDMANVSNVGLRQLQISQTLNESVFATNVSSFTLAQSDILNSGENGVTITGSGGTVLLDGNRIIDVNNNGLTISAYQNVTIRGNTIRRVGMVPGRGKSGDGQYNGVQSAANQNVLIENNVIDSIGYNGIGFWNNTTIRRNVISNYCMTKSDGGGLYVWNGQKNPMTNIHIVSNIIYNGIGAPEGSLRREYSGANGIFLDDCVENVELKDNTVFNNHQWGIYLHAVSNDAIVGNTSFDNGSCQFIMYHNGGQCLFRDNVVKHNTFVSKHPNQLVGQFESNTNDLLQYGTIDSNYYARPFDETATIRGIINWGQGGNYALTDWQNFSGGHDLRSKKGPLTYSLYRNEGAGGTPRINSTFDATNDNWFVIYSRYNNMQAERDPDQLDGGSLRIRFPAPSGQTNSYGQVVKPIGTLTKGNTYVLRFDAVATTSAKLLIYLRQYGPPFHEFDRRYLITVEPTRQSYELPFVASENETNAILMVQVDGEGPTYWIDNVRLQEGASIRNHPDDYVKLVYNATFRDSVATLNGLYRDVKGQLYTGSLTVRPFTSVVLFKDAPAPSTADLSLTLQTSSRVLRVDEPFTYQVRIRNQSTTPADLTRWTLRLPANMEFVNEAGATDSDNVKVGTVSRLNPLSDTTFTFLAKSTQAGLFRTSAQITTATSLDPDSSPNSGQADGEDDVATVDIRVGGSSVPVYSTLR